jgi:phage tail-like protein
MLPTLEQILATLSIDSASAVVYSDGRYVLLQRDPQPDETGLPVDTGINLTLVDLDADPAGSKVDVPDFVVLAAGEPVVGYISGTESWGPLWTGYVTPYSSASPFVFWTIAAVQVGGPLFVSEQVVEVEFALSAAGTYGFKWWTHDPDGMPPDSPISWSTIYSFTIVDLTPPRLLSVVGKDTHVARATFDDAMTLSGAGSVLDPDHWTISRENVDPDVGASLTVVEVAEVDGDPMSFDLTFQWEQTPGCPYRATVDASVTDDAGNAIDSAFDNAAWSGWEWPVPAGRAWSYWHNMTAAVDREQDSTQDFKRITNVIQEALDLLLREIDRWPDQFDPDLCSDADIDAMLFDLGNPFVWDSLQLTTNQRRRLVRELVPIYQLKGTAPGIEGVVRELLGIEVRVVDYISDTWCLGLSPLGTGEVAEVVSLLAGPFDLSAGGWPKHLTVKVDDGVEQDLVVAASDFADTSAATTAELVAALASQIVGGGVRSVANGSPALVSTSAGPFVLSAGLVLRLLVDGVAEECVFQASDFVVPASATADEVARALAHRIGGISVSVDSDVVTISTMLRGPGASLVVDSGTAEASLGLTGLSSAGSAGENLAVHSLSLGLTSAIEVTGGEISTVCLFERAREAGLGAAVLGPGTSYALYCFDIETLTVLPSETVDLIRKIGTYMKAAHEHLINIRPAPQAEFADGWILGVTALGDGSVLFE